MAKRTSTQTAVYNASGITLTDGAETALFVDSTGALLVTGGTGGTTTTNTTTTSAVTSVANTTSSTTLIASNASAKERVITNTSPAILYVKFGTTASSTDYTIKLATDEAITTGFTGRIDGIWSASSTGGAAVTELS